MKNTLKVLGIIALLAVIGFSMAACSDDSGGGGNGGTITLTDIPAEYNGKYASFSASTKYGSVDRVQIFGIQPESKVWFNEKILTQISDGKAVMPVQQQYIIDGASAIKPYKGNDTFQNVWAVIYETPIVYGGGAVASRSLSPLKFSNGSAKTTWNFGEEWTSDISSGLAGTWFYNGQELFSIQADGSGSIKGQGNYSVQERFNPREARFTQGNSVIGQFKFSLNGEGVMWIESGTGPFASWANIGGNPYLPYVIKKQ